MPPAIGRYLATVAVPLFAMATPACGEQEKSTEKPQGELVGGDAGRLHLVVDGGRLCGLSPVVADGNWNFYWPKAVQAAPDEPFRYKIPIGAKWLDGEFQTAEKDGAVSAVWTFSSPEELSFEALIVTADFSLPLLAGGVWETDEARGVFPQIYEGSRLFNGNTQSLVITFPDKRVLKFSFPTAVEITLQDNRQWGRSDFTLRIGRGAGKMAGREHYSLAMDVTFSEGLLYRRELPEFLKPVTLQANDEWIPLQTELDIIPGSALDLSSFGFTDGACGSKGRIIVTQDGHFAYSGAPGNPRRFYGVNLCFSAQYLAKEKVDRLLDRLVRLGYNTLRIHHYESRLTPAEGQPGFDWNPAHVDQLDYLMAGCARRGIWITTDLYVSRPISGRQIGLDGDMITMDKFKALIPVYEPAFQDWAAFAHKFLDRVNPYTGRRIAEDPALAWISLVNEGPASNNWGEIKQIPEWTAAWNRWLAAHYPTREELEIALGDLTDKEDLSLNTVALPDGVSGTSRRARLCQVFVADTEKATFERMRDFLRNELRCPALLTNMNNAGPGIVPLQAARARYDYVDEHFYVDHPSFLEKPWRLPSTSPNSNPIAAGAPGSSAVASVRLWGKPFTVSEYNYSGPGRFRGVGGILTGAMAALQDWDALWRFAYSHTDKSLFEPMPISYFDLVSDPLNQVADRLALFLYLRKDLAAAPSRFAMIIPRDLLRNPPKNLGLTGLQAAAWNTRIGSLIVNEAEQAPASLIPIPIQSGNDKEAIIQALGKIKTSQSDQAGKVIRSETEELTIAPDQGVLTVDTPKSAGGYADSGKSINSPTAGVKIDDITTGATIFVNSLDQAPIKSSGRLLVTHLTDLQNTGIRYGESARQSLYDWGSLPYLVRDGSATVSISLAEPEAYSVWVLSTSGKRGEKLESKVVSGQLVFTARVRGTDGARMLYEVAR